MFEAMMLLTAQQAALSNPQAPQGLRVETPLTAEQRAAKARRDNMNGWAELNARWKREAAENEARRYSSS
jgi:hypothetical protein